MTNVLDDIVAHKRREIAAARQRRPLRQLEAALADTPPPKDFVAALRSGSGVALIAEIKQASPSAGVIREDFEPIAIARAYADHGAACISVLTDKMFFRGHLDYLQAVRQAVTVPLLRKDFVLDPYQVIEARAAGADAVLLIAECLDDATLAALHRQIGELGMTALVELYEPENLDRVLALKPAIVGVNNRNLKTFVTDLDHSVRLRSQVPAEVVFVAESGIRHRDDVRRLQAAGVDAMLVGETLMRCPDIGAAVDALLARSVA